ELPRRRREGHARVVSMTASAPFSTRGRPNPRGLALPLGRWARRLGPALLGWVEGQLPTALAIVVSVVLFGGFVAAAGHDPLDVYAEMYRGAFGTWFSFQNSLLRAAPLMLTGLCTALPARLGLMILGGEGARVMGRLAAAASAAALQGDRKSTGLTSSHVKI